MSPPDQKAGDAQADKAISLEEFLSTVAPLEWRTVGTLVPKDGARILKIPSLRLFCSADECQRVNWFDPTSKQVILYPTHSHDAFFLFLCRDCGTRAKRYAVTFSAPDSFTVNVIKVGD